MSTPFPFDSMLVFAFLSVFLLMGTALRAKTVILQKFLFPGCLIGGILGMAALQAGLPGISLDAVETFAYHLFNISFISVGLTGEEESSERGAEKGILKGSAWMALVQGLTFPMQAVIGGLVVIALGAAGMELFPTFGFLVPLGFNEGPGQALSIGKAWEGLGFADGATIGLTFAAAGYFFSFFIGVPLVNYGIRKGWAVFGSKSLSDDFLTGVLKRGQEAKPAGRLTFHTANVETLAFQTALIGAVYAATWGLVRFLGSFLPPDAATILWGFFFFFGLGVAYVVKTLMKAVGIGHLTDPGLQRRITGWSVDYLIVATVAAIQLKVIWSYLIPVSLIALTNGILTTLIVIWCSRRLKTFPLERCAAIFGTVTGTVSCGLLLLRIADPDFKSPVAFEIAMMNIFALPIVGGCTLLVNGPLWWNWSLGLTMLVFTGIFLASFLCLRVMESAWNK